MTQVLSEFIKALREDDVRISPAEVIDAEAVLALVGYGDRDLLRTGLSQALAKSTPEKEAFDAVFERYFTFEELKPAAQSEDSESEDQEGTDPAEPASPEGEGAGGSASGGTGGSSSLTTLLEQGNGAELQMRLAEAARQAGMTDIRFFTQRGQYAWRILQLMGAEALSDEIEAEGASPTGAARAARLRELRENLRADVRNFVDRQLALFAGNEGRRLREEVLSKIQLSQIDRSDMKIMRALVRKMAKRLVSLHSRRRKVARRGELDVRRTIRANIEYEGLPFHTIWKHTKIDRPKVFVLCDVSGSVAQVARFLLMFLYSLHEVLPDVRSFAFSGELGEVTELFEGHDVDEAMALTMQRYGGSTDYGQAFADFSRLALADVDRRTTVLILGDARSNYGEPRADILKQVHERAKRVLFINPEARSRWNTGDSVMSRYEPHCNRAITCSSLRHLERVVSDLLRTAA